MASKMIVKSQVEALAAVKQIAASHGFNRIVWGTGYPISTPHVTAVQRYFEINVTYYPKGEGYMLPTIFYTVSIEN